MKRTYVVLIALMATASMRAMQEPGNNNNNRNNLQSATIAEAEIQEWIEANTFKKGTPFKRERCCFCFWIWVNGEKSKTEINAQLRELAIEELSKKKGLRD